MCVCGGGGVVPASKFIILQNFHPWIHLIMSFDIFVINMHFDCCSHIIKEYEAMWSKAFYKVSVFLSETDLSDTTMSNLSVSDIWHIAIC